MDWYAATGILAGVIPLVAMIPYVRDVLRRETKPNVISWSIWTVVVLIIAVGQVVEGPSWSLALLVGGTLQNLIVLYLCVRGYGYKEFRLVDKVSLVLAVLAIALWFATSNALIAILLALTADAIAYIPTYAKILSAPKSETYTFWGSLIVADILAILSVEDPTIANLSFPIGYGILNAAIFVFAYLGKRRVQVSLVQ